MSEMVERVARALGEELGPLIGKPLYDPEDGTKWWNAALRSAAVAAITAMREPTKPMVDTCHAFDQTCDSDVWGWMIDAALEDAP